MQYRPPLLFSFPLSATLACYFAPNIMAQAVACHVIFRLHNLNAIFHGKIAQLSVLLKSPTQTWKMCILNIKLLKRGKNLLLSYFKRIGSFLGAWVYQQIYACGPCSSLESMTDV